MLTQSSVAATLTRIMRLASRPLTQFNKHEALELVESLKNAAHDTKHEKARYFALVYETLRGKLDQSDKQFRDLLLPLLGDKDIERVRTRSRKSKNVMPVCSMCNKFNNHQRVDHHLILQCDVSIVVDWAISKRNAVNEGGNLMLQYLKTHRQQPDSFSAHQRTHKN